MITLADVSYAYPDAEHFALEGVNLHVDDGEILGVVGASGAGKTTFAKIIAGFIPHVDGGELTGMVDGGWRRRRRPEADGSRGQGRPGHPESVQSDLRRQVHRSR